MKHINLEGDKIVLTFPFEPSIVSTIRSIDGRKWDAGRKRWEVPKENISEIISKLIPLGFTPSLEVKRILQEEEKIREEVSNLKVTDVTYQGPLPLFDFQRIGANFLAKMPHALLADVPGLGKSIQTIAALQGKKGNLILCPASLKYSWQTEILKWCPEADVVVIDGSKEERIALWGKGALAEYAIANYELLLHDFEDINWIEWETIVADEATRISNPQAQTTKNLKKLKCKKRIALTGTPVSNSPEDIFSILDWLVPGYLGSYYQFRDKYCVIDAEWYNRIIGYKNIEELAKKVDCWMLRRTKEQVLKDLPPKTVEQIVYDLSDEEKSVYKSVKESVIEEIKKITDLDTRSLNLIPVKMLRLKQCTNHTKLLGINSALGDEHPAHIKSSKLELLKEMLKPIIESGDKAIIFTQFAEMLQIMREELKEYNPLTIYGEVTALKRMEAVQEFNHNPDIKVIIMTEAGAYGLNMQAASYVFHYDAPWSLAKLVQREDRAHRQGQKKPVTVYHLIAKGTIDEYVLKVLKRKGVVSEKILQDGDREEMTLDDINEILDI